MLSWLLAFIPAPWLAVLKALPWRLIGYVALAAAIAFCVWRVVVWREGYQEREAAVSALAAEQDCANGTKCSARLQDLNRAGADSVEEARKAAQEAAKAEQSKLDAEAQAERERLTAAASVAAAGEKRWRQRYESAISQPDGACARWNKEPVPCPIE